MGIVADTTVFTSCERKRWTSTKVGIYLAHLFADQIVVIPAVAAAEMVHGIYRTKTSDQLTKREGFVRAILDSYTIATFTEQTAWIAGKIRGEQAKLGNTLPLADSLIAAAALELNYAVLTLNIKDFARIPGLQVIPFNLP
jgi:tRNA(fMet)-specific endonuclease VapC